MTYKSWLFVPKQTGETFLKFMSKSALSLTEQGWQDIFYQNKSLPILKLAEKFTHFVWP